MRIYFLILLLLSTKIYSKPLSIVTIDDNPPLSFTLPDKTLTGLYVEFWQLWAKHNHQEINIYVESYEKALIDVRFNGAIHSGLFSHEKNREWASYSLPIHSIETGVLLSRKYNKLTQLKDLSTIKVAVEADSIQARLLKKEYESFDLLYYTDPEPVINKLLLNEIDALVAEVPFIKSHLSKLELNGVLVLSDERLLNSQIHAVVAKGNQELLDTINKGILNIPLLEIIELELKWLPNLTPFFSKDDQISFLTNAENTWLKNHKNFSLGIDTSWYPYDFIDDNGKFSGIAADYISYLNDTLAINFNPEYKRKWTEAFELFKQGKIDIMSGVIATENRKKTIDFTQTYFKAPTVIVTKKNGIYVGDIKDLNGKKLGLVKGFAIVELIKNDYPDIKIELVNSIVEGLENLQNGKIDAYLGTLAVVNYEIDKHGFDDIKIASFAPYNFEISMAVRKGLEPLLSILNKSFDQMSEKQKTSIANDWLAIHIARGTDLKTILKWTLPILIILILVIIVITRFNNKLQIQIKQRKKAQQELLHIASHDSLTGLSNWRSFEVKFKAIIENEIESHKALLFLDLDGFKNVNDAFGHAYGDTVLIDTSKRLQECVKDKGFLARAGGDEFVVLLTNIQKSKSIDEVCSSIIQSISLPYLNNDNQVTIGVSIGISIYPSDSIDLDTLVKKADTAMYKAKNSGKNNFKFY
jgi:diguanylate cyclase (GGDEF)-like protein